MDQGLKEHPQRPSALGVFLCPFMAYSCYDLDMTNVMPVGWEPQIRGRRPLVDPRAAFRKIKKNKGQWVIFDQYKLNECKSLDRQLTKMGCLVSIEKTKNGKPRLYGKWEDEQ